MIENFEEALEIAAGAGTDKIVTPERILRVREIIKRFCESLPSYTNYGGNPRIVRGDVKWLMIFTPTESAI